LNDLGYRIVEAENAADARQVLNREAKIDLILSDVILPGGESGPEFTAEAAERYPDLKVLFMSGYPATDGAAAPRGDEIVLKKPFRKRQLAEAVRNTLQSKS
jgi:DNA-binding NtrC family response regulator